MDDVEDFGDQGAVQEDGVALFDIDAVDDKSKSRGSWGKYLSGSFLIAHSGNLAFQRTMNRLQQPHRKKIDKGTIDPKVSLDIMCEAMAKHILLDWKNVGQNGQELEYSEELAYKVLRSNDDLREFVQEFSLDLENFKKENDSRMEKS